MAKRIKQPPVNSSARIGHITEAKDIPAEQQPPAFSLRYLQGEFCLTRCETDDQSAFALKMHRLSQLTWGQIQSQDRHKLGYEKIPQESIRATIPSHIKPDVNFLAFRFSGLKPMVGYREGVIFYVIWLDRNFTLYKH